MPGELAALRDILSKARPADMRARRPELAARLAAVARQQPASIVHLLFDVLSVDPDFARSDAMSEVLRAWIPGAVRGVSADGWGSLAALLRRHDTDLVACLSAALPRPVARELPDDVGRGLARRLLSILDERSDVEADTMAGEWDLLARVAPAGAPAGPADWLCVLGDRADRRGDTALAMRRYLAAINGNSREAVPRAVQLSQREARRLLASGDVPGGRSRLADALRLEPTPELQLLDVIARLAETDTDVVAETRRLANELPVALFWSGIASIIRGDEAGGADALRDFLASARPDTEPAELATVLVGAIDGDAERLVAGTRALLDRYGAAWEDRAPIVPAVLLSLVATPGVLDLDPDLVRELADTIPRAPDAPAPAAARVLAAADQAIMQQRFDVARQRLDLAERWLVGGDAVLRDHAERLRGYLDPQDDVDSGTYALLMQDGERWPWTESAQRAWEAGGGIWRDHHLAIAYHAHAYDLEAAGEGRASGYWSTALVRWAEVHADDEFWKRVARKLTTVMDEGDPAAATERVRARLPRDLLAPHVTLAGVLRTRDPKRARRHVDLIRGAPFSRAVVAEARAALARDARQWIALPVREGRHEEAIDELRPWLSIDPTNPGLLQAVLHAGRAWLLVLSSQADWVERSTPLMKVLDELLQPFADAREKPTDGLVTELARLEYWHGRRLLAAGSGDTAMLGIERSARSALRASISRFEAATRLDPGLRSETDQYHAAALVRCAQLAAEAGEHNEVHLRVKDLGGITTAHWSVWWGGLVALAAVSAYRSDRRLARELCARALRAMETAPDPSESHRKELISLMSKLGTWE
jgi:hypothetical protein